MPEAQYSFTPGEPSIFVELYLPKKPELQGVLYETLSRGFDLRCLRRHLDGYPREELESTAEAPRAGAAARQARVEQIQVRLRHGYPELIADYEQCVRWLREEEERPVHERTLFFRGYSLYEVQGVFYNTARREQLLRPGAGEPHVQASGGEGGDPVERRTKDAMDARRRVAEQVQVIRLMFRFEPDELFGSLGRPPSSPASPDWDKILTRLYLQAPVERDTIEAFASTCLHLLPTPLRRSDTTAAGTVDSVAGSATGEGAELPELVREKIQRLARRVRLIALFIFGYLVFEIEEEIRLRSRQKMTEEEEIWVTSFWNLVINRITKNDAAG